MLPLLSLLSDLEGDTSEIGDRRNINELNQNQCFNNGKMFSLKLCLNDFYGYKLCNQDTLITQIVIEFSLLLISIFCQSIY